MIPGPAKIATPDRLLPAILRYRLRALRLAREFKHAIEGIDLAPISNS
jgi:hypothetical protein